MSLPSPALLAAASLLLTAACSPPATSPDAGVAPSTTATPPSTTTGDTGTGAGSPGGSVVGAWVSPSCGDRTYPRHIELTSDGTFHAEDLVSPCPPKVVCVWSGVVHRKGTYAVAGDRITLTVDGSPGAQGKPLPDTLGIDPTTSAPFEPADGSPACAYSPLKKEP